MLHPPRDDESYQYFSIFEADAAMTTSVFRSTEIGEAAAGSNAATWVILTNRLRMFVDVYMAACGKRWATSSREPMPAEKEHAILKHLVCLLMSAGLMRVLYEIVLDHCHCLRSQLRLPVQELFAERSEDIHVDCGT